MINTPVTIGSVGTSSFHTHSQYPLLMSNFKPFNLDQCNEAAKRINMHDELMRALCDIQQMCIGEIAMGYKLEAETIGQLISAATGLTAPELLEKCK